MSKIDELQLAVTNLQASVDATQEAIAVAIKALQDQIANGATEAQLQGIIDGLATVQTDVEGTPTA